MGLIILIKKNPQFSVINDRRKAKRYPNPVIQAIAVLSRSVYLQCGLHVLSVYQLQEMGLDWIHSDNVGLFQMVFDKVNNVVGPVKSAPKSVIHINEKDIKYVSYELTGPRAQDILSYDAPPVKEFSTFTWDNIEYRVYIGKGVKKFELPLPIIYQLYVRDYLSTWRPNAFQTEGYYEDNKVYSIWSLDVHQQQWQSVLGLIDRETLLIAPGDGVGVISRMWNGPVIAGDNYIFDYTDKNVRKESIVNTLMRGLRSSCRNKVIVLSYVAVFLSDLEWKIISDWKIPVYILDFNSVIRSDLGNCHLLGRGLVAYGDSVSTISYVAETRAKNARVLYTENLIRVNNVYCTEMSIPIEYLFAMNNTRLFLVPDEITMKIFSSAGMIAKVYEDEYITPLANNIPNLLDLLEKFPKVYFAPIGRTIDCIECVNLGFGNLMMCRTVYETSIHFNTSALLGNVNFYDVGERRFFFIISINQYHLSMNF